MDIKLERRRPMPWRLKRIVADVFNLHGRRLVVGFSVLGIVLLMGIFVATVRNLVVYMQNFGPESQIQTLLKGDPNRFAQDGYEMLVTLHKLQADCLRVNASGMTQTKFDESLAATSAKFSMFAPGTKNWEDLSHSPAQADAMKAVANFLDLAAGCGAVKARNLPYGAYDEAVEQWALLNSDATVNDYKLAGAMAQSMAGFMDIAESVFSVVFVLVVLCCFALGLAAFTGIRLIESERDKRRKVELLMASIGHDLRSPLQSIQSGGALLGGALSEQDRILYSGIVKSSTKTVARLVDDIVQVVRSGELSYEEAPIVPSTWFADLVGRYAPKMKAKGLEFEYELRTQMECLVIDADRLDQCVGNLLDNALKYTESGKVRLTVDVRSPLDLGGMGALNIQVSDTGVGIPSGEHTKVFLPFERGSGSKGTSGMGLGLSLVAAFVRGRGGSVTIDSALDSGSTFDINIPVKGCPTRAPDDPLVDKASPPRKALREILLVDGMSARLESIRTPLIEAGYDLQCVGSTTDQFQIWTEQQPFAVVMGDSTNPALTTVALRMRAHAKRPQFIGIVESGSVEDCTQFDQRLDWPADVDNLFAVVEKGLADYERQGKISQ